MMTQPCPEFLHAQRIPEKTAIFWSGRSISWVALNNYVHSTSRYLKEISVKKNDRVILVAEASAAYYIAVLALWRIGAWVCEAKDTVDVDVEAVHVALKPHAVICHRSLRKVWARGVRFADIEHIVAYGYNDAFLGSDAALDPKVDPGQTAVLRLESSAQGLAVKPLTHESLSSDRGSLSTLLQTLLTGEPLVIS
ncbi:MAG: AMP-binding protein [Candidatus Omnitrophota bacterium]